MIKNIVFQELDFKAVRSSGAGGQHVNKVSSKVLVTFDIPNSAGLTFSEKDRLTRKLKSKISKDGILQLSCGTTRSQHRNKDLVIKRFFETLKEALRMAKRRKKTRPKRSAVEKRLFNKKKAAQKKARRAKPKIE